MTQYALNLLKNIQGFLLTLLILLKKTLL